MTDTGRIRDGIGAEARRILFGETVDAALDATLPAVVEIDRAHLVMLAEEGLVPAAAAARLLGAVERQRRTRFAALRGRPAPRGVYLLYEEALASDVGAETAGALATARSRNDLGATAFLLRLRAAVARLHDASSRLEAVLLRRAWRARRLTMPLSTHGQPALPATYGYYLAGVASAVGRDAAALVEVVTAIDRCPLGAGAVAGTTLPIRPERTAGLLGFTRPVRHALDAVASRDLGLRALAAAAILGVTISRIATDLLHLISDGWLALPDHLVGSSSAMPQKRNPYFLEHVQGKAAAATGAWTAALTAMHGKPFTNSIAVGTEGVAPLWPALTELEHALVLLRLVVADARPDANAMSAAGERGFVTATELANRLVVAGGVPFRRAHYVVGTLVNAAIEQGVPLTDVARQAVARGELTVPPAALDRLGAAAVAAAAEHGGGPGTTAFERCWRELADEWSARRSTLRAARHRWASAACALDAAAGALADEHARGDI